MTVVTTSSRPPFGCTGRVTGRVAQGEIGEVVVSIRGGSERFYAYPSEDAAAIEVDTVVVVVEYQPPRTVLVEPAPWAELPAS